MAASRSGRSQIFTQAVSPVAVETFAGPKMVTRIRPNAIVSFAPIQLSILHLISRLISQARISKLMAACSTLKVAKRTKPLQSLEAKRVVLLVQSDAPETALKISEALLEVGNFGAITKLVKYAIAIAHS